MIVGVEGALNEWDPQWMHAVGIDLSISRTILTDPLLYGRSSLQCGSKACQILSLGHVQMLIVSAENVHHSFFSLPPLDIYGLKFAFHTETVPIKISQTFLYQLYIINPASFLYLCLITIHPCIVVFHNPDDPVQLSNKHTEFLACCDFSIKKPSPPNPTSCVYVPVIPSSHLLCQGICHYLIPLPP